MRDGLMAPINMARTTLARCTPDHQGIRSHDSVGKTAGGHRRRGRSAPRDSRGGEVLRRSALAVLKAAIAEQKTRKGI